MLAVGSEQRPEDSFRSHRARLAALEVLDPGARRVSRLTAEKDDEPAILRETRPRGVVVNRVLREWPRLSRSGRKENERRRGTADDARQDPLPVRGDGEALALPQPDRRGSVEFAKED